MAHTNAPLQRAAAQLEKFKRPALESQESPHMDGQITQPREFQNEILQGIHKEKNPPAIAQ